MSTVWVHLFTMFSNLKYFMVLHPHSFIILSMSEVTKNKFPPPAIILFFFDGFFLPFLNCLFFTQYNIIFIRECIIITFFRIPAVVEFQFHLEISNIIMHISHSAATTPVLYSSSVPSGETATLAILVVI